MKEFKFFQNIDDEDEAFARLEEAVEELTQTMDRYIDSQNQLQVEIERFLYDLNARRDEGV